MLLVFWVVARRLTPPPTPEQREVDAEGLRLAGGLLAAIFGTVGISIGLVELSHWDIDIAFSACGGAAMIAATVTRFAPFWWHPKALFLRSLIGDGPTTALYVLIGLGFMVWSYNRHLTFVRFGQECSALIASAPDTHTRIAALSHTSAHLTVKKGTPLSCGRMVELGRVP